MKEIFIKYNPYKVETDFLVDGKPVKKDSELNVGERRLQEWIEDLPKMLLKEYNTKSYKITFNGTVLDYEDLISVISDVEKEGFIFEHSHIPAKEVADKEKAIKEIFGEIQEGPFDELKQPDLINAFKNAQSKEFPVDVIATMSAGKSTLINSLLRQRLLPAKQEACTATITEIRDNDNDVFRATVYDSNGELIETHPELTLSIMDKLNSDPSVSKICAKGNIPFVNSEDISLVLVDTPGPNNSRDSKHNEVTSDLLVESSKALVLYILNATQLGVNDDSNLLNQVADSMRVGGKQSKDRFIFIVNKLDEFKPEEDSVEGAIVKVREYLENKGIKKPHIYPVSALTALDIRTTLKDDISFVDKTLSELHSLRLSDVVNNIYKLNNSKDLHLEQYAPSTKSIRRCISDKFAVAEELSKNENDKLKQSEGMKQLALIHSGIVSIEAAIQMHVLKYAKTEKIKNIVDTFEKKLESKKSFENIVRDIATNKDKRKEILAQISSIEAKLDNGEDAKKFKDNIAKIDYGKEVESSARSISENAQTQITGEMEKCRGNLKKKEAEDNYSKFVKFTENLQLEFRVKLENILANHVAKNAKEMLEQYKQKISDLSSELMVNEIKIDTFEIIGGDFFELVDYAKLLGSSITSVEERVKVGSHKEFKETFGFRRWINNTFGTNINVDYDIIDDYDWQEVEYVDGSVFAKKFFAPIQKQFLDNFDEAVAYAKEQTNIIKKSFNVKFDELDAILKSKLAELEKYANNKDNVEKIIEETENRLKWLKNIQNKIKSILDI